MSTAGQLIKLVPTIQSASLLKENIKLMNKKKKKSKDFLEGGVKNIIGIEFTKMSSQLAGGFD
jgi:histidinol phosphatase-like PHP family hydrolase